MLVAKRMGFLIPTTNADGCRGVMFESSIALQATTMLSLAVADGCRWREAQREFLQNPFIGTPMICDVKP